MRTVRLCHPPPGIAELAGTMIAAPASHPCYVAIDGSCKPSIRAKAVGSSLDSITMTVDIYGHWIPGEGKPDLDGIFKAGTKGEKR